MASLINQVKSVATGRTLIGLTGFYKGNNETIDLDLVDGWSGTHTNLISSHPIEKDTNNDTYTNISDHVSVSNPVVTIDCILSYNTNLTSLKKSITAKEKLQTLLHWQSTGTILYLEGYGTGKSGLLKKVVSLFSDGVGALYDSEVDDPSYLGIDSDEIKNLIIGNIVVTRKPDLGNDIQLKIDVTRVKFEIPKNTTKTISVSSPSRGSKSKPAQSSSPKPTTNQKVSSTARGALKK